MQRNPEIYEKFLIAVCVCKSSKLICFALLYGCAIYIFLPIQKLLRRFSRKAAIFVREVHRRNPGEGFSSFAPAAAIKGFAFKIHEPPIKARPKLLIKGQVRVKGQVRASHMLKLLPSFSRKAWQKLPELTPYAAQARVRLPALRKAA